MHKRHHQMTVVDKCHVIRSMIAERRDCRTPHAFSQKYLQNSRSSSNLVVPRTTRDRRSSRVSASCLWPNTKMDETEWTTWEACRHCFLFVRRNFRTGPRVGRGRKCMAGINQLKRALVVDIDGLGKLSGKAFTSAVEATAKVLVR